MTCAAPPSFLEHRHQHRHEVVAVASYPRSGSSLSRSLLERLTGVWTGSDFCRNDTIDKARPAEWSEGESVHDPRRVWLVKTHSRFDSLPPGGPFAQFRFASALLVVRHPLDVFLSFWSFTLADERHDVSVPSATFAQFGAVWDAFIAVAQRHWQAFHRFWLARAATGTASAAAVVSDAVPTLVVRYEDLTDGEGGGYARAMRRVHDFLYLRPTAPAPAPSAAEAGSRLGCMLGGTSTSADAPSSRSSSGGGGGGGGSSGGSSSGAATSTSAAATYYRPRARDAKEAARAFTSARRSRVLAGLRAELCVFGYAVCPSPPCAEEGGGGAGGGSGVGGGGGWYSAAWGAAAPPQQTVEFACTPAERSALRDGTAARVLGLGARDGSTPRQRATPGSSANSPGGTATTLAINAGNDCSVAAPHAGSTAGSTTGSTGSGPSGFRCSMVGAAAPKKLSDKGARLSHPFEALACVREAARANGIDISGWDHATSPASLPAAAVVGAADNTSRRSHQHARSPE